MMWYKPVAVLAALVAGLAASAQPVALGPELQGQDTSSAECLDLAALQANGARGHYKYLGRQPEQQNLGIRITGVTGCSCSTRTARTWVPTLTVRSGNSTSSSRPTPQRYREELVRECVNRFSYRQILPGPPPVCGVSDLAGAFRRADGLAVRLQALDATIVRDPSGRWAPGQPKISGITHVDGCSFNAQCHNLRMVDGASLGTAATACTLEFDKTSGTMTLSGNHGVFVRDGAAPTDSRFQGQWRLADEELARIGPAERGFAAAVRNLRMTISAPDSNGRIASVGRPGPVHFNNLPEWLSQGADGQLWCNALAQPQWPCTLERQGDRLILSGRMRTSYAFVPAATPSPTQPTCPAGAINGHYGRADGMKISIINTPVAAVKLGEVSRPAVGIWPRSIPKFSDIRQAGKNSCVHQARCHTLKRIGADAYDSTSEACTLTFDPAAATVAASPTNHGFYRLESR